MEPDRDAVLRLAAQRHPASRDAGSLHLAQHRLGEAARAFVVIMSGAGRPGARPLPPPAGRSRWPRSHQARSTTGWPVPVEVERPFQCWIDVTGQWWMLRFDESGSPIDAHLSISQGAQENYCRPAVDVLFRSVTEVYGGNVLAVILTGMGSDGRSGCVDLKERGAHVIVQDKETSVVWGMPGAVASAGLADDVLPLDDIAPEISRRVLAANTARSSRRN